VKIDLLKPKYAKALQTVSRTSQKISSLVSNGKDAHMFLWNISVEADVSLSYVHIALKEDALQEPAGIFYSN
jgi:hypothetical protein